MTRVGIGYDSHRFVADRPLVLGGVRIPHERGLAGHSDADAVAHALTDAILGAAGAGFQLGSIWAGLFTGFVVWVVFSVVVRSEERLLRGIYAKEFEDYRAQVPRFFPNPRLWRDIPTILVMPSRMVRTFGDGMMFLLSVPLADLVERLQNAGVFPILFHIA